MVKIVEMDESVTLKAQLEEDVGPVILLNKFTVIPEDTDEFLKVFSSTTEMFKQQPGFISAQLHHGIGGSNTFFNYVVWESAKHFKQAFNRPEFLILYLKISVHLNYIYEFGKFDVPLRQREKYFLHRNLPDLLYHLSSKPPHTRRL